MPTAPRPAQSLLALTLVATLLAASVPAAIAGNHWQASLPQVASATPVHAVLRRADPPASMASAPSAGTAAATLRAAPMLTGWIGRPKPATPDPRPTAVSKGTASATTSTSFKGRNHLWIPALGISRSVSWYSCSNSAYPGNRVYRWGCAGSNNVYLFGHAHSVFKSLHDAYVRGRLRKGMKAYYAGPNGKVATFAVWWWKVTTPEKGAWAYAAQDRASMTLQTCVGAKSQYRLIVRLRLVG